VTAEAICCELAAGPRALPLAELEALMHQLSGDAAPGAAEAAASLSAFLPHSDTHVWTVDPAWRLAVLAALARLSYRSRAMEEFHRCLASIQP
jgi:hypothetical protein